MKKRGFTLIEMLIVIIIIGILAATLIPRIGNARDKANDTARVADVRSISTAVVAYGLENGTYPDDVDDVAGADYGLGGVVPTDPSDGSSYTYVTTSTNDHFAVCAKMSSTTASQGNATAAIAANFTYSDAVSAASQSAGEYYCYVG